MSVWLPISASTKACHVEGWSDPEYKGIDPDGGRKWLGLRCDNLVVIDCDTEEACAWWLEHIGLPMEHTYTVRTTHGYHFYYSYTPGSPVRSMIGTVHEGLDVKAGRGSLVVVPPSPGKTELFDIDVMPFNRMWIPSDDVTGSVDDWDEIPDGKGNNTMTAIGGALRKQGMSQPTIESVLLAMNPIVMRRDPMAADKIEAIAKSVSRYETSPDWDVELDLEDEVDPLDGLVEVDDRPTRLMSAAQRATRPVPQWLIEHVVPETGVGQIFGKTYTGKTFVALDMVMTLANGGDWYGNAVNRVGDVVYILMEGVFDFNERIASWLAAHPEASDLRLWTLEEESVDLANRESLLKILSDITAAEITPVMVVVDTQSLATTADENSNTEMNGVFANLKKMSKVLGCPVMTVHHTGYEESRQRGASSVPAACDFQIQVKVGHLKVDKVKGYKPTEWMDFELAEEGTSVWAKPMFAEKSYLQQILDLHGAQRLSREQGIVALQNAGLKQTELRNAYKALLDDGDVETETEVFFDSRQRRMTRKIIVVNDDFVAVDFSQARDSDWEDETDVDD